MRLNISLATDTDPQPIRLVIDAEPAASVDSLTRQLAATVGGGYGRRGEPPRLFRGGTPLDPRAALGDAGLYDGVELGLNRPARVRAWAGRVGAVELRVVSGPGAGTIFQLPPGEYQVGRAAACRVRLGAAAPPVAVRLLVRANHRVTVTPVREVTLDGQPVDEPTDWPDGSQLAIGPNLMELAAEVPARAPLTRSPDVFTWDFNRPPRFVPPPIGNQFRLPSEPSKPDRSALPLAALLLTPAIGALIAITVTGNWKFLLLAVASPLGALVFQTSNKRRRRETYAEQMQAYREKMVRIQADIDAAVLDEQRARRFAYPDPALLGRIANLPTERLWERRWQDDDFLVLRVGTASIPSGVRVEDPTQDEHRRTTIPQLGQVPAAVDVRGSGVVGVAGDRVNAMAPWLLAQAAILHSPLDLRICVLTEADGERRWSWLRWLPHVKPDSEDAYAFIGTTAETVSRRVAELNRLVMARVAAQRGTQQQRGGAVGEPDVLVVLDGARRLRSLPGVVSLLRDGPEVGVYIMCVDLEPRLLPEECRATVISSTESGVALSIAASATLSGIRADEPGPDWYERIAHGLAPLRSSGDSDEAVLPTSARLLDVLGLEPPTGQAIAAGWALRARSTVAVLGTGLDGAFAVDLVRDGPHALIAGTTGSGKSELLQTLVASLAVANRPDEMTFVLLDYKGGSAFAECADLPHTVGLVTDLDTHLVERALISLGAELRRREHVLATAGAPDIDRYNERRARDASMPALPRLLLVIDEFASMVRELPDFVTGLVNIAQRGRSLGIHLVLATQRPSGAVTADIRANTNLRIALRTTDQNESRDIIDAPEAGELSPRTPGRAYARLGYAALLPFQAGRIGGRRPVKGEVVREATVQVTEVGWAQLGGPTQEPARSGVPGIATIETDLRVLVQSIVDATRQMEIAPQPSPWLPALPELICWTDLPTRPAPRATAGEEPADLGPVAYGVVDLPEQQSREPLVFDPDRSGHLHILGSGRSGRSQALRTLAAALARQNRSADLHLYGVDCGNGALLALTALPHCGAVIDRLQIERLGRMLDWFGAELTRRQTMLGQQGVADLTELRRVSPPQRRPAHLVLLVDRFEAFERDFATYDNGSFLDRLVRLLRDGAGVGIHLVLAGDRVLGSSRFAGSTEDKLVLRLNDRSDYSLVGISQKDVPTDQAPGRAIRLVDGAEAQIAVLAEDTSGAGQATALAALAAELTARDLEVPADQRPRGFGALPDQLTYDEARKVEPANPKPLTALVGVGGDEIVAIGPDLADIPTFAVGGPPRSGRSTALLTIARSLLDRGTGLLIVAPRRSPLRDLAGRPGVAGVVEDAGIALPDFRNLLQSIGEETGAVIVDDAELLAQSDLDGDLNTLARGAAGNGWGLVVGGNAEALSLGLGGWMTQVKRNRCGVLLAPQNMTEGELIGLRIPRGIIGQAPQPGRGYLHLGDGSLITIQIPGQD